MAEPEVVRDYAAERSAAERSEYHRATERAEYHRATLIELIFNKLLGTEEFEAKGLEALARKARKAACLAYPGVASEPTPEPAAKD